MRRIEELRFDSPIVGRWSRFLLPPPEELAPFVEVFWEVHGFAHFARERILPKTSIELMFNLGPPHRLLDPTQPAGATIYRDAWVSGLQQRLLVIEPCFDAKRLPSHLMAARLRPAGAYAFFGLPMNELSNDVVALDLLSGLRFSTVHSQLLETSSRQALRAARDARAPARWSRDPRAAFHPLGVRTDRTHAWCRAHSRSVPRARREP